MRTISSAAAAGLVLGGLVAVISHFISHTLPETYYIGENQSGNRVDQTVESPPVHPSWWPTLPVALVVGLLVGLVLGLIASRLRVSIVRSAG